MTTTTTNNPAERQFATLELIADEIYQAQFFAETIAENTIHCADERDLDAIAKILLWITNQVEAAIDRSLHTDVALDSVVMSLHCARFGYERLLQDVLHDREQLKGAAVVIGMIADRVDCIAVDLIA